MSKISIILILIFTLFIIACGDSAENQEQVQEENTLEDYYADNQVEEPAKIEEPLNSPLTGAATKEIEKIQEEEQENVKKVQTETLLKSIKGQLVDINRKIKSKEKDQTTNSSTLDDLKLNFEMAKDLFAQTEKDFEKEKYDASTKNAEIVREMLDNLNLE